MEAKLTSKYDRQGDILYITSSAKSFVAPSRPRDRNGAVQCSSAMLAWMILPKTESGFYS